MNYARGTTAPALLTAVVLAAGIAAGDRIPVRWSPAAALVSGVLAVGLALLIALRARPSDRRTWALVVPGLAVVATGFYRCTVQHAASVRGQTILFERVADSGAPLPVEGGPIQVVGRQIGPATAGRQATTLTLALDRVRATGGERWRSFEPAPRVRVVVGRGVHRTGGSGPPAGALLRSGRRLRIEGLLRWPEPPRNPAEPDYGRDLVRRGLAGTLFTDAEQVHPVDRVGSGGAPWLGATRGEIRRRISHLPVPPPTRAMMGALVLGDRSGIPVREREQWARTGLLHLLAISGLHMMLIGFSIYTLLGPLLRRFSLPRRQVSWIRASITLGLLLAYTGVAGWPSSEGIWWVVGTMRSMRSGRPA